jgi:predicted RNA-binding protein associated with RNAse of E/G family
VSPSERVRIHYRRLPDREEVFDQRIVLERPDVIVTVTDPLVLSRPVGLPEQVVLESGSRAVWLTFPGEWHDVGRFHLRDGTFTGYYANILTPVEITPPSGGEPWVWQTTDLFLDVTLAPGGAPALLDEDELEEALALGHIDQELAAAARAEAERLMARAATGAWPPRVAREWTLERIEAEERSLAL